MCRLCKKNKNPLNFPRNLVYSSLFSCTISSQEGPVMPHFKQGDLFDAPGVHIVTASSCISQENTLVMGLGACYAMKCRYPDAPEHFGTMISNYCGQLGVYGLLLHGKRGILQSRRHFNDRVDVQLIMYGVKILAAIAEGQPTMAYNLIHPGMGYGRSMIPEIEALLKNLPDNIHIWKRG
jgi:hypothetical protein